jgi:hypothetical protein
VPKRRERREERQVQRRLPLSRSRPRRLSPSERTPKADVRAALGEAVVVDFASGYEVWVYRERDPEQSSPPEVELVLLFEPSGILVKTRVR